MRAVPFHQERKKLYNCTGKGKGQRKPPPKYIPHTTRRLNSIANRAAIYNKNVLSDAEPVI
jgi:hypothetical protein